MVSTGWSCSLIVVRQRPWSSAGAAAGAGDVGFGATVGPIVTASVGVDGGDVACSDVGTDPFPQAAIPAHSASTASAVSTAGARRRVDARTAVIAGLSPLRGSRAIGCSSYL